MRLKYEYAGLIAKKQSLTVFVEVVTGSARRVVEIQVPWSELAKQTVLWEIDAQVRRELMANWAADDVIDFPPAWED